MASSQEHLKIDNGGRLKTKIYDFTFPIINFPFVSSNIPASPAYEIYISQLNTKTKKMSNTDLTKNQG
jgi:hypothetical protein